MSQQNALNALSELDLVVANLAGIRRFKGFEGRIPEESVGY
jgi:hypothetical protein